MTASASALLTRPRLAHTALFLTLTLPILLTLHPQSRLYPPCPIHTYLHLLCPGCGATRALTALLHGHLTQAFHQNPLFLALLPVFVYYAARAYHRALQPTPFQWPQPPKPALYALTAATLLFTLARNLPN